MPSPAPARILIILLALAGSGCMMIREDREAATAWRFRSIAAHLDSLPGPLPDSLAELCARGMACGRTDPATLFRDAWRRPVRYARLHGSYELRSAGADGQWTTGDDLFFSPAAARAWRDRLAGCYQLFDRSLPSEVRLDTTVVGDREYAVGPEPAWTNARWFAVSGTTAHLHRNDSYHNPTDLRIDVTGDRVTVVRNSHPAGRIPARRTACRSDTESP